MSNEDHDQSTEAPVPDPADRVPATDRPPRSEDRGQAAEILKTAMLEVMRRYRGRSGQ